MISVKAPIQLISSSDISLFECGFLKEHAIRKMDIDALVGTGLVTLAINETIKTQLVLKVRDRRTA